ncbi:neuropeptide SIFamide receptor-like isoform X1 [Macrosteles quadrilineatus]|uniref:neuropeptide SIFamide receptor-like isoform X1 n=2 Tax=Macrosteles quadrilineatus TaxID=74068 RepID=UPI0023E09883|nr:neuropeptide SIFamide receptor-like isoform X1 [Macrosteles quadrilineatus]
MIMTPLCLQRARDVSELKKMDNDTEAVAVALPLFRYPTAVTVLLCVAYVSVFIIGVVGNTCVVMVVYRSPKMRSSTNLFIANLACADLLVNIICLPFTLTSNIMSAWTMGWLICKIIPYLQGVSVNASINTLVAISVERCFAICYPLKWQISSRVSKRAILAIWLLSLTITLPWAVFFKLQPLYEGSEEQACLEVWPTNYSGNVYFIIANLLMCYLLPLTIITACYLLIWRKVFLRRPPGELRQATDKIIQKSKVKVVKMLMTVIILFAFSWLPLYLIFTRIKLGGPLTSSEEGIVFMILPFAQWLGASNSCINPILYAYFNRKFRVGFRAIIYSRSCCTPLYYDPSGSDMRTVSSKQNLYLGVNQKDYVIKQFQNRKTKSCAVLFSQNLNCSSNSLNKIKPVVFPKLSLGFRSVSVDNIFDKPTRAKCKDIFL